MSRVVKLIAGLTVLGGVGILALGGEKMTSSIANSSIGEVPVVASEDNSHDGDNFLIGVAEAIGGAVLVVGGVVVITTSRNHDDRNSGY